MSALNTTNVGAKKKFLITVLSIELRRNFEGMKGIGKWDKFKNGFNKRSFIFPEYSKFKVKN